ncbi:MAG TPA: PGPGW domain-containing protein [Acidimicrobiales bacterium]|nr:PGPGW domain-containing protein [Acidimicrobiales bacterium]
MHSFGTLMRFIWRSSKRAAVFVAGVALLVVGLIMFVTPGPGIVLVVAGLAVLATEFAWAEHLLDKAKEQAAKAGRSAQRLPGVGRVSTAAGRLIPRRWRRATELTVSSGTVTTAGDEVLERTTVTATELTPLEDELEPPVDASAGSTPGDADSPGDASDAGAPPRSALRRPGTSASA